MWKWFQQSWYWILSVVVIMMLGMCVSTVGTNIATNYQAYLEEREKYHALPALQKVHMKKTERFVSFYYSPDDAPGPMKILEVVQKASEEWMQQNPEYKILGHSTSQNRGTFTLTLQIEKKTE